MLVSSRLNPKPFISFLWPNRAKNTFSRYRRIRFLNWTTLRGRHRCDELDYNQTRSFVMVRITSLFQIMIFFFQKNENLQKVVNFHQMPNSVSFFRRKWKAREIHSIRHYVADLIYLIYFWSKKYVVLIFIHSSPEHPIYIVC